MRGSKIPNPNILEINQYAPGICLYNTWEIYDRKTKSCNSPIYHEVCMNLVEQKTPKVKNVGRKNIDSTINAASAKAIHV